MDEGNYNFYELLDLPTSLDPESNREELRKAVTAKQRQLSGRQPPSQQAAARFARKKAKLMLELLDSGAKSDLKTLRKHAQQRRRTLRKVSAKDQALYKDFLEIYGRREISKNVASVLMDSSESKASIQPVLDELGVTVSDDVVKPAESSKLLIKTFVLTDLDAILNDLKHDDYYAFLSIGSERAYTIDSSLADLNKRVKTLQNKVLKTPGDKLHALHTNALSHGLTIFRSPASKAEFDNWNMLRPFERFVPVIKAFASTGGIDDEQLETLVAKAAASTGEQRTTVEAAIEQLLERNNVGRLTVTRTELAPKIFCTACGNLNMPSVHSCARCGIDLKQRCYNCDFEFLLELPACGRCGVTIEDGLSAQTCVAEANLHLMASNLTRTKLLLDRATTLTPSSVGLRGVRQRFIELQSAMESVAQDIEVLVEERLVRKAESELRRQAKRLDAPTRSALQNRLSVENRRFQHLMNSVDKAFSDRDLPRAYIHLREAQQIIVDDDTVVARLRSIIPAPPLDVRARVRGRGIDISWAKSSLAIKDIQYVVKRQQRAPGTHINEGVVIYQGHDLRTRDSDAPSGVSLFYSVFARLGEAYSTAALSAASGVFLTDPVRNLRVFPREAAILLQWDLPQGASDALVYRMPVAATEADLREENKVGSGTANWVDREPVRDSVVSYWVQARYYVGTDERTSSALKRDARVAEHPSSPTDVVFDFSRDKQTALISWSEPKSADEVDYLLCFPEPVKIDPHRQYQESELPHSLNQQTLANTSQISVDLDYFGTRHFSIARQRGVLYACSEPIAIDSHQPPTDLTLEQHGNQIHIQWRWPDGCDSAELIVNKRGAVTCRRKTNAPVGEHRTGIDMSWEKVDVEIRAVANDGTARSNVVHTSRPVAFPITIEYIMERPKTPWWKSGAATRDQLRLQISPPGGRLPKLYVLFHEDKIPDVQMYQAKECEILANFTPQSRESFQNLDLSSTLAGRRGYVSLVTTEMAAGLVQDKVVPFGGLTAAQTF